MSRPTRERERQRLSPSRETRPGITASPLSGAERPREPPLRGGQIENRNAGRRTFRLSTASSRPNLRPRLRRAAKSVAARFFQLLSGHAMMAPFLREKWGWTDSDRCWWCERGRQSREQPAWVARELMQFDWGGEGPATLRTARMQPNPARLEMVRTMLPSLCPNEVWLGVVGRAVKQPAITCSEMVNALARVVSGPRCCHSTAIYRTPRVQPPLPSPSPKTLVWPICTSFNR